MLTTSEAADVVGVRYETLRNWLKKGLLDGQAPAASRKSRKWRDYSASDIVRLQLTKNALDAGIPLNVITDVCNDPDLLAFIEISDASSAGITVDKSLYVLIWPTLPEAQFMFASELSILAELRRNRAPVTILSIYHASVQVNERLATVSPR